jgi:hypothetical protein
MIAPSRFLVVEGAIDRILGSHRTTDVNITEHSNDRSSCTGGAPFQAETHTFVNTSREFAMLLEVKGRTLKLVSDDYIAAAEGDDVRALCQLTQNGPLVVKDWHNRTRAIRFRTVPQPFDGWIQRLLIIAIMGGLGIAFVVSGAPLFFRIVGACVLLATVAILAEGAAAFRSRAHTHAEMDRLTA